MNKTESLTMVRRYILDHLYKYRQSETIYQASRYSIEAGGKGLRPMLLFTVLDALAVDRDKGLSAAAALEMIHTYSLIHDDLPAMDNDDLRRGKPTNHVVFGEATAILAGDNLLNESYKVISNDDNLSFETRIKLINELASASGQAGMISGQMFDIEAENKTISLSELERIHQYKTGALIRASVSLATIVANASEKLKEKLIDFSMVIGVLFQIKDDILDIEGKPEETGKNIGSDEKKGKVTYVSELGLNGAKLELEKKEKNAYKILTELDHDIDTSGLREIVAMFADRTQ